MTAATTSRADRSETPAGTVDRPTSSALYEGRLRHRRFGAVRHEFESAITMTLIDLDEIDRLDHLPLWSRRRRAPVELRRADYLDGGDRPWREALGDVVEAEIGRRPSGPVRMLTHLRTWGWLFNPITVYWCFGPGPEPAPDIVVLEVTNTPWKERHWYVVEADRVTGRGVTFPKALPVSPFLDMDLDYRLSFTAPTDEPGSALDLRLELLRAGRVVFDADLDLVRRPLTRRTAVLTLVRHPLQTLRVSAGIHGQALRLLAKRVPIVAHPQRTRRSS